MSQVLLATRASCSSAPRRLKYRINALTVVSSESILVDFFTNCAFKGRVFLCFNNELTLYAL